MYTLTHSDLAQFTGSLERFRHTMVEYVIYTPGVRHVARQGGAYWLIDEIALAIAGPEIVKAGKADPRIFDLHFWHLTVYDDQSAILEAKADSGEKSFYARCIPSTDFPFEHFDIWAGFDGDHWTLYLPSEH